MLFEGNISVKAALQSSYREVLAIIVDKQKKDRDTNYILTVAKNNKVPISYVDRETINQRASGKTHGGIIAEVSDRVYQQIDEVIQPNCFFAIVEGIEDPYNFGYIMRSLYAAGCNAIITNNRNWSNAADVVAKASAGASEYLAHISSDCIVDVLDTLKHNHIPIVCAARDENAIELYDFNFKQSVCICIGGEKRGLSKDILKYTDQNVFIPYNSDFRNALNAVSATTILAFELVRQRK